MMGRFSFGPAAGVQVVLGQSSVLSQTVLAFANCAFHCASQPVSGAIVLTLKSAPFDRCVCLPEPSVGSHPDEVAATKARKRPTVVSYLSSLNELTVAG